MCLYSIMSKEEQDKTLEKMANPVICWKTVAKKYGTDGYTPLHQGTFAITYRSGVNNVSKRMQEVFTCDDIVAGAHFFRHRADAVAVAKYNEYRNYNRRVVRCLINKKDINCIGISPMACYNRPRALTILAHKATFAKTFRKVS